jgi:hypothetical protein
MSRVARAVYLGEGLRVEPAAGMVDTGGVCRMERVKTEGEAY